MTAPVFSENTRRAVPAPTTVYPSNTTKTAGISTKSPKVGKHARRTSDCDYSRRASTV